MKRIVFWLAALLTALLCVVCAMAEEAAVAVIDGTQVFVAEAGGEPCQIESGGESLRTVVRPGSTIYFSIANATRAEDLNGLRVVVDWSKGGELTEMPRIEYRRMMDETGETSLGFRYVAAVDILDTADIKPHTLRGYIKIAKRANASAPKVSLTILVRQDGREDTDRIVACTQKKLILEFSRAEEMVQIAFYDRGFFEVNVTGQGPLNVGCSTEPVTDIAERYPGATLKFLTWGNRPFFNRSGKLVLYAGPGSFLYALNGNRLVELSEGYSEQEGGFVVITRRLEGFVISDRPLDPAAVPVPQPNPPTGAHDK
ncbi:hypothetical protein ACS3UN_10125 [Oscillospiraceae bacterium LTW-04]|nr:hypothetical protein RBH76_11875 [Oscillospiraceae bacterium MB24-C1]